MSNHERLIELYKACRSGKRYNGYIPPYADLVAWEKELKKAPQGAPLHLIETGGAILPETRIPMIDTANPAFLSLITDFIEKWIKGNCHRWRYEDDSFAYSFGSINSCHKSGHEEFDPPDPLMIEIAGCYPCYSDCIESEIYNPTEFVNALWLSDITPDNLKITAGIKRNLLTVKLEQA